MLPDAADDYYRQQQALTVATLALSRQAWGRMTPDLDRAWEQVGPLLALIAQSAQSGAASAAEPYLLAVLLELALDAPAEATPVPSALVGYSGDGRSLDGLLRGALTTTKEASAAGLLPHVALAVGGRFLDMAMHTLVADAGRTAVSVGIAARPQVTGYVRMLRLPSCSRCAILAGRFYRWSSGFRRHPRCDCRHIPATEHLAGDLTTDPQRAYEAGQVRGLSAAQDQAVKDGGDLAQVVNARRGMDTLASPTTSEGTTRRGAYGRTSQALRLTPEAIYERAGSRAEAISLLRQYGYLA